MKIPNDIQKLKNTKALIIVAGKQRARLYSVKNGEIREIDHIKVEKPKYSDKEGFFARSGQGMRFSSGAPYENLKQKVETEFLKELEQKLKKYLDKFNEVYLFCPKYMHRLIEERFPNGKKKMLKEVFFGNIVGTNPLNFVDEIEALAKKTSSAARRRNAPPEARKILRKSRAARRVVKGRNKVRS